MMPEFAPPALFESDKEEAAALDAEEQSHSLLGEIIRKRSQKTPRSEGNTRAESSCDSDRVSLLSVDISSSSLNLNFDQSDAKI